MLVFPKVIKAGFGIGGEYGEGALRINGRSVGYYNLISASIGLQLGAQSRAELLLFMTDEALERFQSSDGWEAGDRRLGGAGHHRRRRRDRHQHCQRSRSSASCSARRA